MVGQGPRGGVAVRYAQLAASPVAVGVDRSFRHAQFAGDLLGTQVPVDQTQAIALSRGEKFDWIQDGLRRCAHRTNTLATRVTGRLLVMLRQA